MMKSFKNYLTEAKRKRPEPYVADPPLTDEDVAFRTERILYHGPRMLHARFKGKPGDYMHRYDYDALSEGEKAHLTHLFNTAREAQLKSMDDYGLTMDYQNVAASLAKFHEAKLTDISRRADVGWEDAEHALGAHTDALAFARSDLYNKNKNQQNQGQEK